MRSLVFAILIAFVAVPAMAEDSEKVATVEKGDKPETAEQAPTQYVPPPGYKTRRRGAHTVYCQKTSDIGSRFKTEKCFTQEQLAIELRRIEAAKEDFERRRRVCSDGSLCGSS
jgi:invasion protein IalB